MSISLSTRKGSGTSLVVYVKDVTGSTVTAEFSSTSSFRNIALTKTPTVAGRQITVALTAGEVDALKDSYFRIKSVKDGVTEYIEHGSIDYTAPAPTAASVLANSPELKAAFGPVAVDAIAAGVPANGTTAASAAIITLFNSGATRVYFGPGTYLINVPVTVTLTGDLFVEAHPDAIFKLANNANCWMINIGGTNKTNRFRWTGGQVDGNNANQGAEAASGNFDLSKGFRLINFKHAEVGHVTVREMRGHAINHWNNNTFYGHHVHLDQAISDQGRFGGRRRDGITGSSTNIILDEISGYTGDDMIAVLSGASWGGAGTVAQNVESVNIGTVRPGVKVDPIDGTSVRHTWHGVSLYPMLGTTIDRVKIDAIIGDTERGHIRGGSTGGVDYYGKVNSLSVGTVAGTIWTNYDAFICLGGGTNAGQSTIRTAQITNVDRYEPNQNTTPTILCDFLLGDTLSVANAKVTYATGTTTRAPFVKETGNGTVANINLANVAVVDVDTPSNTSLLAYQKSTTDLTSITRLRAQNVDLGPFAANANKYTVAIDTGTKVATFGDEIAVADYSAVNQMRDASCTDRNVGVVYVDPSGNWRQRYPLTVNWSSSTYGKPFGGAWKIGMQTLCEAAPYGEFVGWRCVTAGTYQTAVFEAICPDVPTTKGTVPTATWVPTATNVTPGTEFSREMTSLATPDFPATSGILRTYVGRTTLLYSFQEFTTRGAAGVYRRTFDGTNWTAWVAL